MLLGNRRAQRLAPGGGRIVRIARPQTFDRAVHDGRRRVQIRIADAEQNDILAPLPRPARQVMSLPRIGAVTRDSVDQLGKFHGLENFMDENLRFKGQPRFASCNPGVDRRYFCTCRGPLAVISSNCLPPMISTPYSASPACTTSNCIAGWRLPTSVMCWCATNKAPVLPRTAM